MKKMLFKFSLSSIILFLYTCILLPQTLEQRLIKFGEVNGKAFIKPFVSAFGANLNSGIFNTADVSTGVDVYVGAKFLFALIPSSAQEFDADMSELNAIRQFPLEPYPSPVRTATIFGNKGAMVKSGGVMPDSFKLPDGMNLNFVPLIVPHISIGNLFGTRAILRYFPSAKIGDWGEISFIGFGVQHSIDQWLVALPFHWSAHAMYQSFKIKPLLDANTFNIGTEISKTFLFATVYGGVAFETSSMEFKYNWIPLRDYSKDLKFKINGINSFKFTAGLSLKWLIFNINAEYNLANQPVAVLGLGIAI